MIIKFKETEIDVDQLTICIDGSTKFKLLEGRDEGLSIIKEVSDLRSAHERDLIVFPVDLDVVRLK